MNRFATLAFTAACLASSAAAAIAQEAPGRPAPSSIFRWVDTNVVADWGGHDIASTSGDTPDRRLKGQPLCDQGHAGFIATCWSIRTSGYPASVPTDIVGNPNSWCTYKDASIKLTTPPNGHATPGRVYVCGAVLGF